MAKYIEVDPSGTVTLRLPPEFTDRYAEIVAQIEERFGFEGLNVDSADEIDEFVKGIVEPDAE